MPRIVLYIIGASTANLNNSQRKDYFENRFQRRPQMAGISRESVLLISALLKCLIYAILENGSYDKALPKLHHLPNVFVFFINVGQSP